MKNRLVSKLQSITIAGVMVTMSLAACGSPTAPSSTVSGSTAQTDTNVPASSAATEVVSEYPISDGSLKLKYWIPIGANATSYVKNYGEIEPYKEVAKNTGVAVDFIHPAVEQETESFNLMMAADQLPDIINCGSGRYKGGESAGVDDGVFADLTEYIPKYAPDYYKLVTSDPELLREVTDDKGRFIGFYKIKPDPDPPFRYIMSRNDTLKELGLTTPETLADYETLLKALKETKKITPMMLPKNGYEEQFMGMYDIRAGFYLKDGKVAFGQTQEGFKSYLELMNKWYKAGYIGSDFPSLTMPQQQALFDNGSLGLLIDACVVTYNRCQKLGFDVDSAPYPRLDKNQQLHWNYSDAFPQGGEVTVISAKSKNIAEAVRWLNYGYTKEGADILNYGIEGKTYTVDNGVPTFTEYALTNPDYPGGDPNLLLKVQFSAKLTYPDIDCSINLAMSPEARAMRMKYQDIDYLDSALIIPPIKLTSDESTKRAKLLNDINTYCDEMTLKFITGNVPLTEWDNYIKQIEAMGLAQAVEITQVAYDRYML